MFDSLEPQERVALIAALSFGFAMTTDTGDERLISNLETGLTHVAVAVEISGILGELKS